MTTLKLIAAELIGLFVDDGHFALAIVAVVAIAAALTFGFHAAPALVGAILALGCLLALIESALRAARGARP